ncbi:MAG: helix-turn-helix domain-containing protein [Anaerotruncus colihominis]
MICKTAPQDQSTIKYNNMKMILDIIRDSREVSRSEIARMTGMSPTSATRIVGSLEECGLVRDMAAVSNGGRKAVMLDGENAFIVSGWTFPKPI